MKKIFKAAVVLLVAFLGIQAASAVTIQYGVENLGGNRWQYNYTVKNDAGASTTIDDFAIFFDYGLYNNLTVESLDIYWESDAPAQPQLILGVVQQDGYFAPYATGGAGSGLAPGDSLNNLSVSFDWLGGGTPGSQGFKIYDYDNFDNDEDGNRVALGSGNTVSVAGPSAVPEPQTFALLGMGLLGLAALRRQRRGGQAR